MRVRKAVIPAAGWGTRLLPATKAVPKELLPVVDKPAIQYVVEEAAAAGIEEILLITSRGKGAIADHFDRAPTLERELALKERHELLAGVREPARLARFYNLRQPELRGLGDALRLAEGFAGGEPLAVLLPDDLVDAPVPCLKQLADVHAAHGGSVVAVQAVAADQVSSYGVIRPGAAVAPRVHQVTGLVEKPRPETAPSNLAVVGRYILSPAIFPHLAALRPGRGGELQLTDALARLADEEAVYACQFRGARYDMGSKLGFLQANIAYALDRPDLGEALLAYMAGLVARAGAAAAASEAPWPAAAGARR